MKCPKCNTIDIPNDARFCPNCGYSFAKNDATEQNADIKKRKAMLRKKANVAWAEFPNKPERRTNYFLYLWLLSLVVIVISVICIYSYLIEKYQHNVVPKEIVISCVIYGNVLLILSVFLFIEFISFDPDKKIKAAKKSFVDQYIKEHINEMS